MPFLRGLVVLYDTLVTGTRWCVRHGPGSRPRGRGTGSGQLRERRCHGGVWRVAPGRSRSSPARRCARREGPAAPAMADQRRGRRSPCLLLRPGQRCLHLDRVRRAGLGKGYQVAVGGNAVLSLPHRHRNLLPAAAPAGPRPPPRSSAPALGSSCRRASSARRHLRRYLLLMSRMGDVRRTFPVSRRRAHVDPRHGRRQPANGRGRPQIPHRSPALRHGVPGRRGHRLDPGIALVGSQSPLILSGRECCSSPIIAAVSYEILQLGARHRGRAIVPVAVVAGNLGSSDHHQAAHGRHDRSRESSRWSGRSSRRRRTPEGSNRLRLPAAAQPLRG